MCRLRAVRRPSHKGGGADGRLYLAGGFRTAGFASAPAVLARVRSASRCLHPFGRSFSWRGQRAAVGLATGFLHCDCSPKRNVHRGRLTAHVLGFSAFVVAAGFGVFIVGVPFDCVRTGVRFGSIRSSRPGMSRRSRRLVAQPGAAVLGRVGRSVAGSRDVAPPGSRRGPEWQLLIVAAGRPGAGRRFIRLLPRAADWRQGDAPVHGCSYGRSLRAMGRTTAAGRTQLGQSHTNPRRHGTSSQSQL